MRKSASEIIRNLESRIARLEKKAIFAKEVKKESPNRDITPNHPEYIRNRVASGEKSALEVSRSTTTELSLRSLREIASELNCRVKDCYTQVLKEGYDRELGITYLLVYGENEDLMDRKSLFFVVADDGDVQAVEDSHKSERDMNRFFNRLIS